jgi:DNA-binding MarR family transcriptional regulator
MALLSNIPAIAHARVKYITLTECGHGVCESVANIHAKVAATLFAGFTPAELALLNQWLQKVVSNGEIW